MNKLTVIYRACGSETEVIKTERPKWFSKLRCFKSFYNSFGGKYDIKIVWDGDKNNDLYNYITTFENLQIVEINERNNQRSLLKCYEIVSSVNSENVFFSEDDYLFLPDSDKVLIDGLERFLMITLYHHPDRIFAAKTDITYQKEEISIGYTGYFRTHESTTCSVAIQKKLFDAGKEVFIKFCNDGVGAPIDRELYRFLYSKYQIRLWGPINSMSTHVVNGCLALFINWEAYNNSIIL